MTYEITPEHFGFTKGRKLMLGVGLLVCITIEPAVANWIANLLWPGSTWVSPPWHWTEGEIIGGMFIWGAFALCWHFAYNYSLEIDDNNARVRWRVVRKGRVRCLREFGHGLLHGGGLLQGPRLVLSEHGPLWAQFLGGIVVVPKGLPEYEQIKAQISTWLVDAAPHAEE
jgi:hypothetical protein